MSDQVDAAIAASADDGSSRLRSSAVVVGLALTNMLIGLAVQAWLASRLGTGPIADVFQSGITLPTMLCTVALSAVPSTLIPLLVGHGDDASKTLSTRDCLTLAGIALAVSAVVAAGAQPLSHLIGGGFTGAQRDGLVLFLRVTAPCFPLATLCAIAQAQLHADHRFGLVGSGGVVNGIGLGLTAVGLSGPGLSPGRLGVAVLAGYSLQLTWMARGLWTSGPHHERLGSAGLSVIRPVLMLSTGYALFRLQPIVERGLAGGLEPGTIAEMGYASKVQQAIVLMSTFGVGVVALPAFAGQLRGGDRRAATRTLEGAFDLTLCFTLVASVGGLAAGRPAVALMFARGEFDASSVIPVTQLFRVSVLEVFVMGLTNPLIAFLYAAQERRRALIAAAAGFMVGAATSVVLLRPWAASGILLGSGLGSSLSLVLQYRHVKRVLPDWRLATMLTRYRDRLPAVGLLVLGGAAITLWNEISLTDNLRSESPGVISHALGSMVGLGVAGAPLVWKTIQMARVVPSAVSVGSAAPGVS